MLLYKEKINQWRTEYPEYAELNKNMLVATGAGILVSGACAWLADQLYHDSNITTVAGAFSQSATFGLSYARLHFKSKSDEFKENGRTLWKKYVTDLGKTALKSLPSFIVFQGAYLGIDNALLRHNFDPIVANALATLAGTPPWQAAIMYTTYKADTKKSAKTNVS